MSSSVKTLKLIDGKRGQEDRGRLKPAGGAQSIVAVTEPGWWFSYLPSQEMTPESDPRQTGGITSPVCFKGALNHQRGAGGVVGGVWNPDPDKIKRDEMRQDREWVLCMYNSLIYIKSGLSVMHN